MSITELSKIRDNIINQSDTYDFKEEGIKLSQIMRNNPNLGDEILDVCEKRANLQKHDNANELFLTLSNVASVRPDLSNRIVKIIDSFLENHFDTVTSHQACKLLNNIALSDQKLIDNVIMSLDKVYEKNNDVNKKRSESRQDINQDIYNVFVDIATRYPEFKDKIIKSSFGSKIEIDYLNDSIDQLSSEISTFKDKKSVLKEDGVLQAYEPKGIWNTFSSMYASERLMHIITVEPELAKQVFADYKRLFNIEVREFPCYDLKNILFNNPNYADDVLDCFDVAAHKKIYTDSPALCENLADIILRYPEYRDRTLDIYSKALSVTGYDYSKCIKHLARIAISNPQISDKVLNVIERDVENRNRSLDAIVRDTTLPDTYRVLVKIIKECPASEKQGFRILNRAISKGNKSFDFEKAYEILVDFAKECPQFSKQVKNSFNIAYSLDNNETSRKIGNELQNKLLIIEKSTKLKNIAVKRIKEARKNLSSNTISGAVVADKIAEDMISGKEKRKITPEVGKEISDKIKKEYALIKKQKE